MNLRRPANALAAGERIVQIPDEYYDQIPRRYRALAFTITGIERASQIELVLKSMNEALESGTSFKAWRASQAIPELANLTEFRIRTVFQTHMATAYNQGTLKYGIDNQARRPYFRYSTVGDARVRPNHAVLDGVTRPVDDPFWSVHTPPLGYNCRCQLLSITKAQAQRGGTRKGTEHKPAGRGTTPPRQLERLRRAGRPDRGFTGSKLNPLTTASNYFRRSITRLPLSIQQSFLAWLLRRDAQTELWYERNRSEFVK